MKDAAGLRLDDLDRQVVRVPTPTVAYAGPVPDLAATLEERLDHYGIPVHDQDLAQAGVRALLRLMGDDPARSGLRDTPKRVVKAMREMAESPGDPSELLAVSFDDVGPEGQMVAVGPVEFVSLCEHHLLPFTGHAWIAYIPTGSVVGLSKLPRLLEHFARRPQVQERLTRQITEALDEHVSGSKGSACVITATHSCASSRGVRKVAPMTTSSLTGAFVDDGVTRAEFMDLTRMG